MMAFCGREVQALTTSVLLKRSFPVPCYVIGLVYSPLAKPYSVRKRN